MMRQFCIRQTQQSTGRYLVLPGCIILFRANQSLIVLVYAVCLVEKQQTAKFIVFCVRTNDLPHIRRAR